MRKRLFFLLLLQVVVITTACAQWNTNATPVCVYSAADARSDYFASTPLFVRTPDQKTWMAWKTAGRKVVNGNSCIAVRTYLQLLDSKGFTVFEEPIMVNDHITDSWWSNYGLQLAADGSAVLTVADGRVQEDTLTEGMTHATTFVPAIYKIDQQGHFLWGQDGIDYPAYDNAPYTNCYVVGEDTYLIFYNDSLHAPKQQ